MKHKDILSAVDHKSGMTVPEGYFEEFISRMTASLPTQEWENQENEKYILSHRTFWQKVRPYVYMAAMFAGIWCMMNLFDLIHPSQNYKSLDTNPVIAEAISDSGFVNDYFLTNFDGMSDIESSFYDDLYEDGFQPSMISEEGDNDSDMHFEI